MRISRSMGLVARVVAACVVMLGAMPAAAQEGDTLGARLLAADEAEVSWRGAFALGQEAAASPGGLAALRGVWAREVESEGAVRVRQQLVKAWHFDLPAPFRVRLHPETFAFFRMVLEAGDPAVSAWVVNYLPTYAWRTFESESDALAWVRRVEGREPGEVIGESQRRWRDAWRDGDEKARAELGAVLREIGHPYRRNEALIEGAERDGVADLFAWIAANPGFGREVRMGAFSQMRSLRPAEYDQDAFDALLEELRQPTPRADARVRVIDNHPAKRWMLHEPTGPEPAGGYGLLVVLPGGDGSAGFAPFVGGAIRDGAGPGFAVAQLVAPPIAEGDSDAVVWPTRQLPDERVDFTIEPVAAAVLGEVREELRIDPARVYTMGWSSGGPAAYGLALGEELGVRGALVVMSVFKPETLPSLDGARGKSFFILHSPQDFIKMRFPEAARDALGEHGARVRLETYEGGHGWQGGSIGMIGEAVRWLGGEGE